MDGKTFVNWKDNKGFRKDNTIKDSTIKDITIKGNKIPINTISINKFPAHPVYPAHPALPTLPIHEVLPIDITHHIRQLVNQGHKTSLTLHLHVLNISPIVTARKETALSNGLLFHSFV